MLLSDFDYDLPPDLIAQNPVVPRDHSRLMVVNRKTGEIQHKHFFDLPNILSSNYVLVFNESKVIPARLYGKINDTKVEILLLKKLSKDTWQVMVKPGKKFKINAQINFIPPHRRHGQLTVPTDNSILNFSATVINIHPDGTRTIQFNQSNKKLDQLIEIYGSAPLPPYIKNFSSGEEQYQTIYAKKNGSVAAPTAGLHFTKNLFNKLSKKNIQQSFITLHVGRGTFEPVKTNDIKNHQMHSEYFELDKNTADFLNESKQTNKKIVAVGTTSIRVLESCAIFSSPFPPVLRSSKNGGGRGRLGLPSVARLSRAKEGGGVLLAPQSGETNIFIYPGYKFKFIDAIITNFHLPKSTLIMLISAFAGKKLTFKAYAEAIKQKYRFYSFGDAMLIL